jgi:hypothetical protein
LTTLAEGVCTPVETEKLASLKMSAYALDKATPLDTWFFGNTTKPTAPLLDDTKLISATGTAIATFIGSGYV